MPNIQHPGDFSSPAAAAPLRRRTLIPAALLLLVALLLGFLQPLASDTSVYLLQTRTLLEQGNRYLDSHDNKGPLMVGLTAPAVRLLGANAAAAGALRALAALGVAALVYRLLRDGGGRSRPFALHLAALAAALPYSAVLWGDSLRPETYALLLNAGILWLATRDVRGATFAAGVLAAGLVFLKSILVLPAAAMMAGWLVLDLRRNQAVPFAKAVQMAAGALLAAALILGWLARNDSLPGFVRQTLEWPAEYRQTVELTDLDGPSKWTARLLALYKASDDPGRLWLYPVKVPITVLRSGVWPLFLLAGWLAWKRRIPKDRLAVLSLFWLFGVLLELGLEHRRWPYPAAGLLPPLLLWITLAPLAGRRETARLLAVWIASSLLLGGLVFEAARLLPLRLRGRPTAPYEALAREMKARYQPGESLLVLDNNYALHLLLPAPRPPQILPVHAAMVSPAERESLRREIEAAPPTWIASKDPAHAGMHFDGVCPAPVRVEERNRELWLGGPYSTLVEAQTAWARRLDEAAP